jgi:hypothetical protein
MDELCPRRAKTVEDLCTAQERKTAEGSSNHRPFDVMCGQGLICLRRFLKNLEIFILLVSSGFGDSLILDKKYTKWVNEPTKRRRILRQVLNSQHRISLF